MMDPPSYSSQHEQRLMEAFPYAFYIWNRETDRFELWCDEGRGMPYKAMVLSGPDGEYREPGDWVIRWLRETDPDSGSLEHRHYNASSRKEWIQRCRDEKYLRGVEENDKRERAERLRDDTYFMKRHGRVYATH